MDTLITCPCGHTLAPMIRAAALASACARAPAAATGRPPWTRP